MRKKILATLLALCLVIGLLPITALAAELTEAQKKALKDQGYTDEEIANVMVIDEDTELTEDFDGLVVVVGSVNVTVKGANIGVGLVVAPGATGAKITLGENAVVNAVVALEKSDITVSETAQANSLTVTAAETVVTVDGTVSNVGAAASAEKVVINVTAKATVSSLTVAAPNAAANIAGTVATVNVEATAEGTALTVAETGSVTTASVAAPNTAVTVDGTVSTVDVAETATGAQVGGANADKVEVTGAISNVTTSTDNGTVEVGVGGTIEVSDNHDPIPSIKAAPLGNKAGGNIVYAPNYNVNVAKNMDHDKKFDVTIVGTIPKHWSSNSDMNEDGAQGWVGIAIPLATKTTTANGSTSVAKTTEYIYYLISTKLNDDGEVIASSITPFTPREDVTGAEMLTQGIADASLYAIYDTLYLGENVAKDIHDGKRTLELVVVDHANAAALAEKLAANQAAAASAAPAGSAAPQAESSAEVSAPAGSSAPEASTAPSAAPSQSPISATFDADKKALYDAADMILNILVEATTPDNAEYITVGGTSAAPSYEMATTAPSASALPSKMITAPEGAFVTGDPSASPVVPDKISSDAGNAAKPSVPSNAPTYNTAEVALPSASAAPGASAAPVASSGPAPSASAPN